MEMVTKAKTKAQRRMKGRKCKPDVGRTDTGLISRARNPEEAPDLLMRRKRLEMYGVKLSDTKQNEFLTKAGAQEFGTVIGRLNKSGEVSDEQFRALQRFGEQATRYRSVMGVPDSLKKTAGGGVMRIPDDESEIEVRRKWADTTRAIQDANTYHNGNLMAALQFTVIRDEFHEQLIGDCRLAANALVRHYGIS
jgi:hypothetical protein